MEHHVSWATRYRNRPFRVGSGGAAMLASRAVVAPLPRMRLLAFRSADRRTCDDRGPERGLTRQGNVDNGSGHWLRATAPERVELRFPHSGTVIIERTGRPGNRPKRETRRSD